jgi:uncharacterized protein
MEEGEKVFLEVRSNSIFISGYVNATGKESNWIPSPKGKFKEVIKEGVFTRAIQKAKDIQLLFNHQDSRQLGSLKSGNMQLQEDGVGLQIRAEIFDSEIVQKTKQNRSFLTGWSFGFESLNQKFEHTSGYEKRTVLDLNLHEISLLGGMSKPAYPSTSIFEVRKDQGILERRYSDFELEKNPIMDFSLHQRQLELFKLKGMTYKC